MTAPNVLDIVIVNWNSGEHLRECLATILSSGTQLPGRLTVVENCSNDGSMDGVDELMDIEVLRPEKNLGFGGGCNRGAKQGKADFILFLNPDIRLRVDTLARLMAFLKSKQLERDTGIIGVQLIGPEGVLQRNIARFPEFRHLFARMLGLERMFPGRFPPHFRKDLDYSKTQGVDQVPGAFFLVRRVLFDALGGFDEGFFMYYEDVDFSYRARQAGWRTLYLADIAVDHTGGGTTESIKGQRLFYSLRSRLLYVRKHFGRGKAAIAALGMLTLELVSRCARAILRLSAAELTSTLQAYALLVGSLPKVVLAR